MNDTKSASLVMIAGAVGVGYWYWSLKHGSLSAPAAGAGPAPTPGGLPAVSATPGSKLAALEAFAAKWGLTITSGFRPGANSLHGMGRAVDVGVPAAGEQSAIEADAAALGIHIYPETAGQVGANGSVSTGPHWHVSYPIVVNGHEEF